MFARTLRPLRSAIVPRIIPATRFDTPVSIRSLTTESTTTSTAPTPVSISQEIPAAPSSQSNTDVQSLQPAPKLPYYVGRNSLNNIAVYERRDRGGNLRKTLLKKGEGNLQALRYDIAEALGLTEKEVRVNNVTNHIEIKGHRREDVVQFLRDMGF
ncbi:putative Large ribosomal subunit protein mL49 [Seiridium cardinale]|uniref:Large ribosomal subunit protein mL49 n=1 Tax=Seiridium cardinale TaxID=138064 RepID=A0ABR2Y0K6_9PEZI